MYIYIMEGPYKSYMTGMCENLKEAYDKLNSGNMKKYRSSKYIPAELVYFRAENETDVAKGFLYFISKYNNRAKEKLIKSFEKQFFTEM